MKSNRTVLCFFAAVCGTLLASSAWAQDYDDMMDLGDEDESKGEDSDLEGGDEGEGEGSDEVMLADEAEEEDEDEASDAAVPQFQIEPFLGVGYAIPIIGLNQDSFSFGGGSLAGGLPIYFGGEFFVIDNLGVGFRLRFTPMFWDPGNQKFGEKDDEPADEGNMLFFDFQLMASWVFDFDLPFKVKPVLTLGGTKVNKEYTTEGTRGVGEGMFLGVGVGALALLDLTELGPGDLQLEAGLEFFMMFGSGDSLYKVPDSMMYPIAPLVGLRYSI